MWNRSHADTSLLHSKPDIQQNSCHERAELEYLLASFLSSGRSKGYCPNNITYSMTPLDHTSAMTPS